MLSNLCLFEFHSSKNQLSLASAHLWPVSNLDLHWAWPQHGKHGRAVLHQCPKWVWDASVTASQTVAGRPLSAHPRKWTRRLITGLENECTVFIHLRMKTCPRRCSFNPSDSLTYSHSRGAIFTSCLKLSRHGVWKLCSFTELSLRSAFISHTQRQIPISLIDMALRRELELTLLVVWVMQSQNKHRAEAQPNLTWNILLWTNLNRPGSICRAQSR